LATLLVNIIKLDGKYKTTSFFEVKLLKCPFETLGATLYQLKLWGAILKMAGSLGGYFMFFPKNNNRLGVAGEIENTILFCSPLSSSLETQ
jgi:hypothetical protein